MSSPEPGDFTPTTVPTEDLSREIYLARLPLDEQKRPILGGIPLVRKLGRGGMGAVYYGIHPRLHCPVAVKILSPELLEQDPSLAERFLAEARMAAGIRSPHVVQMLDVHREHDTHFCVMEYVDGESAGSYVKRIRNQGHPGLDEEEALEIVRAATRGLADAHAAGIIHRDIKPENILIPRSQGKPDFSRTKILDLGLARPAGGGASLGTLANIAMGTPGYMAPEQARDARTAGKPADIFSMGATLYALLSGRPPFGGTSVVTILEATETQPHAPIRLERPDLTEKTTAIIDRCLAKDPSQRFADGSALFDALRPGTSLPAFMETLPRASVARPMRARSPWLVIAILLVIAGIGTYAFRGQKPTEDPVAKIRVLARTDLPAAVAALDRHLLEIGGTPMEEEVRRLRTSWAKALADRERLKQLLTQATQYESKDLFEDALKTISQAEAIDPTHAGLVDTRTRIEGKLRDSTSADQRRLMAKKGLAEADAVRETADGDPKEWQKVADIALKARAVAEGEHLELAKLLVAEAQQNRDWLLAGQAEAEGNYDRAVGLAMQASTHRAPPKDLTEYIEFLIQIRGRATDPTAMLKAFNDLAAAAEAANPVEAIKLWKRALAAAPDGTTKAKARSKLATLTSARAEITREADYRAAFSTGQGAFIRGNFDEAKACFAEALRLKPKDPDALRGLDQVAETLATRDVEMRRRAEDVDVIKRAEHSGPATLSEAHELFSKAFKLTEAKDYTGMIEPFKRIFYRFPDSRAGQLAAFNVGCAYTRLQDRDRALDWLEICFRHGFDNPTGAENDTDYSLLKSDTRFKDIIRRAAMIYRTAEAKRRAEDKMLISGGGLPATPKEATRQFSEAHATLVARAQYAEAIPAFKKVFYAFPDSDDGVLAAYNVACAYALRNEDDAALDWLEIGVLHGLMNLDGDNGKSMALHARADTDLKNLWKKERFDRILRGGVRPHSDSWGGFAKGTFIRVMDKAGATVADRILVLQEMDATKIVVEHRSQDGTRSTRELPRHTDPIGEARITIAGNVYDCRIENAWLLGTPKKIYICRDGPEAELVPLRIGGYLATSISRENVTCDGRTYECLVVAFQDEAESGDQLRSWYCRHIPGGIFRAVRSTGGKEVSRFEVTRVGFPGTPIPVLGSEAEKVYIRMAERITGAKAVRWTSNSADVDMDGKKETRTTTKTEGLVQEGNKVRIRFAIDGGAKIAHQVTGDGLQMKANFGSGAEAVAIPPDLSRLTLAILSRSGRLTDLLKESLKRGQGLAAFEKENTPSGFAEDPAEEIGGRACRVISYSIQAEGRMKVWVDKETFTPRKRETTWSSGNFAVHSIEMFGEFTLDAPGKDEEFKIPK